MDERNQVVLRRAKNMQLDSEEKLAGEAEA